MSVPPYWCDGERFCCPVCGRETPVSRGLLFNVDDPDWDKQYTCWDCLRRDGSDGRDLTRGRVSVLDISSRLGINSRHVQGELHHRYGLTDTISIDIDLAMDFLASEVTPDGRLGDE